ncbi:hypothetical protein GWI33_011434 [Rhynchophorus ferrugineus]|uniref:Uncharacterized protein n=1 Tax=Rhynchophorus ferrugineus TaxID=354439 RepID=A0A834IS81_RHYFE|nr:hypothetical protein GWI33_011434 [Rhynchophorus ferrugineus]
MQTKSETVYRRILKSGGDSQPYVLLNAPDRNKPEDFIAPNTPIQQQKHLISVITRQIRSGPALRSLSLSGSRPPPSLFVQISPRMQRHHQARPSIIRPTWRPVLFGISSDAPTTMSLSSFTR